MSKKISQLTTITASNVQQTSVIPISQGAETYKISISDLKTLVSPTSLGELHDVESYDSNNLGENWQLYWNKQTELWQTRSFGEVLIKSITSSYTVNMDDDYCLLVGDAVPITIESLREGKTLIIKNNSNSDSCVVNVTTLVEKYEKVVIPPKGTITLLCDGNEWKIINRCFLNSQITFTAQTSYTVDLLNDDVIFCDDLSSVTIDGVQQGKKLTIVNQSKTGSCQIDASIEGSSFYALGPQEKITIIGETINIGEWIIISKS